VADLFFTAKRRSLEEFLAIYRPEDANLTDPRGSTLLHSALANKPGIRAQIANRVLDDGADAAAVTGDGATTLHVLLGRPRFDMETDVPLLQRLLDGGADPNRTHDRFGTPLFTIARQLAFTDDELAPFYDVLLADPRLDLLAPAGDTTYAQVRRLGPSRAALVDRMTQLLRERGQPLP